MLACRAIGVAHFMGLELCLLLVFLAVTAQADVLYVDGNTSTSNHTSCGSHLFPCPNLEAALKNTVVFEVTVYIVSDSLILSGPVVLENSTAFHLKGRDPGGTVITCTETSGSPAGLVFVALDNVTISDIQFSGCGAVWTYRGFVDSNITYEIRAVIHLHQCKDVSINGLNATENYGTGIAIVGPLGGTVTISDSHFIKNRIPAEDMRRYHGGTGIAIYVGRREGTERYPSLFQVSGCTFEHNRANSPRQFSFINIFNQPFTGTGRGGGMDVIMWHNASWNSVELFDCHFHNNTAYLGGGLAIQLYDGSKHNNITIELCTFEYNGCTEGIGSGSGGGAHFGYSFYTVKSHNNNFLLREVIFRSNCAELGGGMTFFTSRGNVLEASASNTFLMDNCSWIGNMAHIGAAVDISPHTRGRTQEGFLPTLVFKDCCFFNNHVAFRQLDLYQSFGSGALFSSLFNVDFVGYAHFEGNTGSALVIVNAIANFTECDATFVKNTGVQGGAISMTGISALHIGPGRTYNFTNNHASDRGGAIYSYLIDDHDFAASRSCFIHYSEYDVPGSEWNVSLHFIENTAGTYGHSIFSSSILSCISLIPRDERVYGNQRLNTAVIFRWPQVFYFDSRTENQIATEGGFFNTTEPTPFQLIPGEEHQLGVVITDDVGQEIETIFRASVMNASSDNVSVDDAFSCLSGNIIELRGETNSSGVLLLQTVNSRKNSIAMNVVLLPCPPGFVLTGNECTCNINTYSAIISCDLSHFQANIKHGYWAGFFDNAIFMGLCPLGFCAYNGTSYEREVPLPRVTSPSHLDEFVCGPTRTGILCGSCKPGYSVFYHSPSYSCRKSQHCEWGWLFYILSELLPVTITFVAVLALNINLTSGHINGFVLFSQLLDSTVVSGSGLVQNPAIISVLSWGYQLIYGIFTIEFFNIEPLSFCLWEGATALDILAFRYVTIIYALLLVLSTLLFLKYRGHTVAKYLRITTIKNSVIHGLSAFIVLCYMQYTKVSINILVAGYVRGENGSPVSSRAFFHGDTASFSLEHLPYALPAIACLMTISTLPPALLILYPSLNRILAFCKLSDNKLVGKISKSIPINKLKPFLDSFQGSFKDNLRFFAGIYFLYRWIALLLFAIIPTIAGFYVSLGNAYIFVLMIHAVFQPYQNRAHNIIDGFLFANLALISSIAGYNHLYSQGVIDSYIVRNTYITTTVSLQLVLIYLPIVGLVIYLVFHLSRKVRRQKKPRALSAYTIVPPPRSIVTSTDLNDLLDGPEEFPARMLSAEYDQYRSAQSVDLSESSPSSLSDGGDMSTEL